MAGRKYSRKKNKWNARVKKRRRDVLHFRANLSKGMMLSALSLILVLLIFQGYQKIYLMVTNNPKFNLTDIEVKGVARLSRNEIIEKAGLALGTNIFSLKISVVEKNIKKNAFIQAARVERKWPSTLVINIVEREPLARIIEGEREYLIDKENKIIQNQMSQPMTLPLITGININDQRLPELTNFLAKIRKESKDLFSQAVGLCFESGIGFILELNNGSKLYWGELEPNKIAEKLTRFNLVASDLRSRAMRTEYIDLRFKNVVVKPLN